VTPRDLLDRFIDPGLVMLERLANVSVTNPARVLVMAIAGQESEWQARLQIGGPARSFWQFEKGGGVDGVFRVTPNQLRAVCQELMIPFDQTEVFEAMAWNDLLATCMARLLLWTDPRPLPAVGDEEGAWNYYLSIWRPGAPHHETWHARYETSLALCIPRRPVS